MTRRSVLIVEAEPSLAEVLSILLEGQGWASRICQSSPIAWEMLRREQPDVVMLNTWLGLPGVGWQLLEQIKAAPATCQLPIVVYSTDGALSEEQAQWLSARGCTRLALPFGPPDLACAITQALQGSGNGARDEVVSAAPPAPVSSLLSSWSDAS